MPAHRVYSPSKTSSYAPSSPPEDGAGASSASEATKCRVVPYNDDDGHGVGAPAGAPAGASGRISPPSPPTRMATTTLKKWKHGATVARRLKQNYSAARSERLLQQLQESFAQLQAQSLQLDEARGALAQAQRQRVQEVHQLQVASGADAQLHRREVAEALAAAQAALRSCEQQLVHRQAALAQASAPRPPPRRFRSPILSAHRSHRPR